MKVLRLVFKSCDMDHPLPRRQLQSGAFHLYRQPLRPDLRTTVKKDRPLAKPSKTALKDFSEVMVGRAVPQFHAFGFSDAAFSGTRHGKDSQGHCFPMIRLVGNRIDLVDILLASGNPNAAMVSVYSCYFKDPAPSLAALQGVDVIALLIPPIAATRYHSTRPQGWFRSIGGPYRVKAGLEPSLRRTKVAAEVERLIADIEDLDSTRKRCLAKTGAYEITLANGALTPVRLIPKGSEELRKLLASVYF